MSSILIKCMEMPKNCAECLNIGFHYVFECVLDDVEHGERRADCPLVSVPPHGRLIDADAFSAKIIEIIKAHDYDDFYAQSLSVGAILRDVVNELKGTSLDGFANAPTIIEAEGE